MTVKHQVDSRQDDELTLDSLQEFIDEAKALNFPGDTRVRIVGKNEGYHFTGTHQFTPHGARVGYESD